jgi:hypothetical protein
MDAEKMNSLAQLHPAVAVALIIAGAIVLVALIWKI